MLFRSVKIFTGVDVDVKQGGAQIEYFDQDPRVHALYLTELAKSGVTSEMGDQFDERGWRPGKIAPAWGAKKRTPAKKKPARKAARTRARAAAAKPAKKSLAKNRRAVGKKPAKRRGRVKKKA